MSADTGTIKLQELTVYTPLRMSHGSHKYEVSDSFIILLSLGMLTSIKGLLFDLRGPLLYNTTYIPNIVKSVQHMLLLLLQVLYMELIVYKSHWRG